VIIVANILVPAICW